MTCTGSYTIVQADIDASGVTNVATATLDGVQSEQATVTAPWISAATQLPVVSISPSSALVAEDKGKVSFDVELDNSSLQTITVKYATSDDTATAGEDYTAISGTLTFEPESTSATLEIPIADDDVDESDESLDLTLSDPTNATLGTSSATAMIRDNDTAGLTLSPASLVVPEGGNAEYTVALASKPTAEVTVTISGVANTDLSLNDSTLTFSTTTWSTAQTVTVTADEDDDGEDDAATLSHAASGGGYDSVSSDLPVETADDETASTEVTLSVSPVKVSESAGGTTVTVTGRLNHAPLTSAATVAVSVAGDTASSDDFGTVPSFNLTIDAGSTSGTQTFTFTPMDDDIDEDEETVTVSGTLTDFTVNSATLTIEDDDTAE